MVSDGFSDNAVRADMGKVLDITAGAAGHGNHGTSPANARGRAIKTVADTGLDLEMLVELVNKASLIQGKTTLIELMNRLKLPLSVLEEVIAFSVREHMLEITHRGAIDADVQLRLTEAGRARTHEAMAHCSYAGPAPVPLEAYVQAVKEHSVRNVHITQAYVKEAFAGTTIDARLLDEVAAALNSARPLMLYGPAGTGKTYLAERLGLLLEGAVPVPYAICVDSAIIQLFDPLVHEPITDEEAITHQRMIDRRWQLCERPLVLSGGELTASMLEVCYDETSGFYQAPPHMKANNGIYIVDDYGRQMMSPQELANRWIVPLDRAIDMHTLHTGRRFNTPFDVWAVFSTNMNPWEVCDDAFLRRLGCKVHVGALPETTYRRLFDAECEKFDLQCGPGAFDYLLRELHLHQRVPLYACYPRDLLSLVDAECRYRTLPPVVTDSLLDAAWTRYFEMNRQASAEAESKAGM